MIQVGDKLFENPQVIEIIEDGELVGYLFIEGRYKYSIKLDDMGNDIIEYISKI